MKKREFRRQLVHIGIGIALILLLFILGRNVLLALSFFALLGGSLLINLNMQGNRVVIVQMAEKLERKKVDFPGYGSAWYMVGVLFLVSFLSNIPEIVTGIFLLGISDGFSTLIGIRGKRKLSYNKKKTWEGSIAFFVTALFTYVWIGWFAIPLAFLASIAEGLNLPMDDNIVVPFVTVVFLLLV